eukprot:3578533-Rhodomonas_salina.2
MLPESPRETSVQHRRLHTSHWFCPPRSEPDSEIVLSGSKMGVRSGPARANNTRVPDLRCACAAPFRYHARLRQRHRLRQHRTHGSESAAEYTT